MLGLTSFISANSVHVREEQNHERLKRIDHMPRIIVGRMEEWTVNRTCSGP